MSIILDALKKSENERRRQDRAGFADLPMAMPRAQVPAWMLVMVGALVSLIVVLGFAYWNQGSGGVASPAVTTASLPAPVVRRDAPVPSPRVDAPAPARALEEPARPQRAGGNDVRPLSREVAAAAPASTPVRQAALRPSPQTRGTDASASPGQDTGTSVAATGLPSADELVATGQLTIPDLHLDLHVYGAESAQRFVFINGQRLRQGDEFAGGVRVAEILPDGVVLQQGGTRFVMSRD
jgi:general secretion pathway protein B